MPRTKTMPTKERIIDVASDIFGKEGFKSATIRKIAKAANANIASINYYFRDKEGLYGAVLEDTFSKGFQRFPSTCSPEQEHSPEQRLYTFIQSMFHRFLGEEGWQGLSGRGKLIARELINPTPAFEDILDTYIKPQKKILVSIITDLSQGRIGMDKALVCALSIIGQCIYYAFATPIIQRVAGDLMPTQENLDQLADHVFRFSLGGIHKIVIDHEDRLKSGLTNNQEKHP